MKIVLTVSIFSSVKGIESEEKHCPKLISPNELYKDHCIDNGQVDTSGMDRIAYSRNINKLVCDSLKDACLDRH